MTHAFNFGAKLAALTQPEDGVKSAANPNAIKQMATSLVTSLTRTPAQAGQKAMMAARGDLRHGAHRVGDTVMAWNPNPKWVQTPGWAADGRKMTYGHLSGPDFVPRRDALSSVGATAARNQGLTQAGVLGGAAGLGALSTAGQQAPPPEVTARVNPPASAPVSPATPTPITPTSLFRRATGIYPK